METTPDVFEIEVELLLEGIFRKYGADFRDYSRASVYRRLQLAMTRQEVSTVADLQGKVLRSHLAYEELLQYLTIPTSEMFRDPEYFLALREHIVHHLSTYPSVKVWVAGCSTGEELYSLAILFHEEGLRNRVHFYATDINPMSLKRAAEGIFPLDLVAKFTQNYQQAGGRGSFSDYYQAGYGSAVFRRDLVENVVFSDHSLATDSVFAEVQFISCRNVLIYFNRNLQDRTFKLFYSSLGNRGFLGLGTKETLQFSHEAQHFEEVVQPVRLYRKRREL